MVLSLRFLLQERFKRLGRCGFSADLKIGDSNEQVENKEGSARQGAPGDSESTRNLARSSERANVSGRKEPHSDRRSASARSTEQKSVSSKNDKKSTEQSSDRKHLEKKKAGVRHKKSSGKGTDGRTTSPPASADSASDSHSAEQTSKLSEHQTRKIKSKETSCTQSEHEEEERSVALYMLSNNPQPRPREKRSVERPPGSSRMDKEEVESSYYLW
ncbi:hypothetical protein Aduo_006384 [Ancylostoma duodenale]